jgi:hypothetical protein
MNIKQISRAVCLAAVAMCLALVPEPGRADSLDQFKSRIERAFAAEDRAAALLSLVELKGADASIMTLYRKRLIPMLARKQNPDVTFAPLRPGFNPVRVSKGWEYRPSVKLLGYVVLDGRTKVPYGKSDDLHVIAGMTRIKAAANPPAEQTVQVIVIGHAVPAMRFEGECTIMQSNNKTRRLRLGDNGHGNQTIALNAVRIESCEVTNLSGEGTMSLRVLEGQERVFLERATAPDVTIRYTR